MCFLLRLGRVFDTVYVSANHPRDNKTAGITYVCADSAKQITSIAHNESQGMREG